jgi:hypothetical protein
MVAQAPKTRSAARFAARLSPAAALTSAGVAVSAEESAVSATMAEDEQLDQSVIAKLLS